ncbi:hypothetical protein U1Q18_027758, partial [Sarracenia purpurea var. burkii]
FGVVALLLAHEAVVSVSAVTCNVQELSSCASAISTGGAPSKLCCTKIKEQNPCLCQYIKNPNLRTFVSSPNAQKVAKTCGVPKPKC